jgi:hypothetical protein
MRTIFALAALAMLVCPSGCMKRASTLGPTTQDNSGSQMETSANQRLVGMNATADEIVKQSQSLPGRNEDEHRQLMAQTFAGFASILPSFVQGTEPNGAFRQQLEIIESTRAQLAGESQKLSVKATIDTGLRAVHNALTGIYREQFYEQTEVATALDALRARIDELDTVRGPSHQFVAGQAAQQSAGVIKQMTTILLQRAGTTLPTTNTTTTTPVAIR